MNLYQSWMIWNQSNQRKVIYRCKKLHASSKNSLKRTYSALQLNLLNTFPKPSAKQKVQTLVLKLQIKRKKCWSICTDLGVELPNICSSKQARRDMLIFLFLVDFMFKQITKLHLFLIWISSTLDGSSLLRIHTIFHRYLKMFQKQMLK